MRKDYKFSCDQWRAFNQIIKAVNEDESLKLFVSGTAGTGKSYLIRALIEEIGSDHVMVAAPTGFTAKLIGGRTIHAICQSHVAPEIAEQPNTAKRMKRSDMLKLVIIDEISMCSSWLLDRLESKLSTIRKNRGPFGGYVVVVFGDLFQLPPVKAPWVFESKWWKPHFKYAELSSNHRQQEDPVFAEMLQRWRVGVITAEDHEYLKSRLLEQKPREPYPMRVANAYLRVPTNRQSMILAHANSTVNLFNNQILKTKFDGSITKHFTLTSTYQHTKSGEVLLGEPSQSEERWLALNSKVMVTSNLLGGLMNGETGIVVGICEDGSKLEHIQLALEEGGVVQVNPVTRTTFCKDKKTRTTTKHLPLAPAYAVTYHKSQGQTLDKVFLHLHKEMDASMLFVGASRVRRREDLYITNNEYTRLTIKVDVKVKEEYNRLRKSIGLGPIL